MKKIVKESLLEYINETEEVFKGQIDIGLTPEDVDKKEFLVGLAVEKKHSTNLAIQKALVMQNLADNPKYYSEGMKKGMFNDVEAINLYKKYFIDKEEIKESFNPEFEDLKKELINKIMDVLYQNEDPQSKAAIRKELEMLSVEQLDDRLSDYYMYDISRRQRK